MFVLFYALWFLTKSQEKSQNFAIVRHVTVFENDTGTIVIIMELNFQDNKYFTYSAVSKISQLMASTLYTVNNSVCLNLYDAQNLLGMDQFQYCDVIKEIFF